MGVGVEGIEGRGAVGVGVTAIWVGGGVWGRVGEYGGSGVCDQHTLVMNQGPPKSTAFSPSTW